MRDSGGNVVQFLYGEDGLDPMSSGLLEGSDAQMMFLARNHEALIVKYGLTSNFLQQGFDLKSVETQKRLKAQAEDGFPLKEVKVGNIVLARRKIIEGKEWSRGNLHRQWSLAEVVKVRESSKDHRERQLLFDLKYVQGGEITKKVPLSIAPPLGHSNGGVPEGSMSHILSIPLIRPALLDPFMSTLPLGSSLGAISERLQSAIASYAKSNPGGVLSSNRPSHRQSAACVSADAFELLMYVKYMRGLACPGEAVGCVAAQSVGESSIEYTVV